MPQITYQPLNDPLADIRLLTIEPSRFQHRSIKCTLSHASLDDRPLYRALSYSWGEPSLTVPIQLNSQPLAVTKNLHGALVELRDKKWPVVLWVDAICINQTDIPERNAQVSIMKNIYQGCSEVVTWLGEASHNSNLALQLIENWGKESFRVHDQSKPFKHISHAFNTKAWKAACDLFSRDWWKRVWVYQEVVVSRNAVLFCGKDQVNWSSLLYAVSAWRGLFEQELLHHVPTKVIGFIVSCGYEIAIPIITHRELRLLGHSGVEMLKTGYGLSDLVLQGRQRDSTDPRDKIFAFLGVDEVRDISVTIDYASPTHQVYADFTQSSITCSKRLDIVSTAGIGRGDQAPSLALPSWVPDFRHGSIESSPTMFSRFGCSAAGDTSAKFTFVEEGKVLHATGFIFDKILEVAYVEDGHLGNLEPWRNLALEKRPSTYPTGTTQYQAFFLTMIAHVASNTPRHLGKQGLWTMSRRLRDLAIGFMLYVGRDVKQEGYVNVELMNRIDLVEKLLDFQEHIFMFMIWSGLGPGDVASASSSMEAKCMEHFLGKPGSASVVQWENVPDYGEAESSEYVRLFMREFITATRSRSFFVTSKGYMGLAPRAAKARDSVCVLYGCNTPVVIRKMNDNHTIVGDCYVHGIMSGEAIGQERVDGSVDLIFAFE